LGTLQHIDITVQSQIRKFLKDTLKAYHHSQTQDGGLGLPSFKGLFHSIEWLVKAHFWGVFHCVQSLIIIMHYIYIEIFWVHKVLYIKEGNLLNHHQCAASPWMMRWQPYCARTPTTHQLTGGEETMMKPISIWG